MRFLFRFDFRGRSLSEFLHYKLLRVHSHPRAENRALRFFGSSFSVLGVIHSLANFSLTSVQLSIRYSSIRPSRSLLGIQTSEWKWIQMKGCQTAREKGAPCEKKNVFCAGEAMRGLKRREKEKSRQSWGTESKVDLRDVQKVRNGKKLCQK